MIKATLITQNNKYKTIELDISRLDDATETKGTNAIEQLHIFHCENFQVIYYGWTDGLETMINKHELPPPIDNLLCYGDLIILLRENDDFVDFTDEDYNEFYNYIFNGFDDCDDECDEVSNDSYDYDDDFVVRD